MSNPGPDIRIIKKLGEGSFAEVFMAKSTRTGQCYAIKRLKKRYRSIDEVNHLPEIYALQALQGHPNIINLLNLSYDGKSGYVSMFFELMDCNVYELITDHKKAFDERSSLVLIYQLLKGIAYIHSKNMFHRDIKPENCMVNKETMVLKLCDFGSTRSVTNSSPYTEYVSTRWYRAPECILTSGSYGPKVDEWAVGCMLYEIMTTRPLFPGKHEIDQIGRIHNLIGTPSRELLAIFKRNPNNQINFAFPQRPGQDLRKILPNASQETLELLHLLLIYDPDDRISAQDALLLPAFAEIRQYEEEWTQTDQTEPFPLFYLRRTTNSYAPKRQKPQKTIYTDNDKPHVTVPEAPKLMEEIKKPKLEEFQQQSQQSQQSQQQMYQSPGAIVTHHQFPTEPPKQTVVYETQHYQQPKPSYQWASQQPKLNQGLLAQTQKVPTYKSHFGVPSSKIDQNLIESRLKAAQRIAEYKKKQTMMMTKKPQPFHGNAFQFAAAKINAGYQKPRPDLIQPRLPKIII